MMNSPLGQYAAPVAALVCAGTIAVYLLSLVFGSVLVIEPAALTSLHDLAVLAFGAVVGSAVAVNGWKAPTAAAHARLDRLSSAVTSIAAQSKDVNASQIETILDEGPTRVDPGS